MLVLAGAGCRTGQSCSVAWEPRSEVNTLVCWEQNGTAARGLDAPAGLGPLLALGIAERRSPGDQESLGLQLASDDKDLVPASDHSGRRS